MIAFLQYEGQTLVLELTPLPGKPGYFDATPITATKAPEPKRRVGRKGKARQDTKDRAKILATWLKENPGKHPLNSIKEKVLGVTSPGTIISVARECVRQRLVKYDRNAHPATVEAL